MAYLRYIVEHDIYRKEQPLFESQMGGTGRKARKEQKKLAKKVKKWQSIRYVNKLIDQMSMGAIAYG